MKSTNFVSYFRTVLFLILIAFIFSCGTEDPAPTPTYTLSALASPSEGGKVNLSPSAGPYNEGQTVTLTPEANPNWVFQKWEGDASGSSNPLSIAMNSNKSVTAVFVKRDYPLNIIYEGEGTVNEVIVTNPSGREYPHGTTVELTPVPASGWVFESWGGDLSGTEVPKRITVDGVKNVTVIFTPSSTGVFYLAENGITCKCEGANPGDKGFINGTEYEAVDFLLLITRINQGSDLSKVCTSLITEMSILFKDKEFNQPIGNWDVSNVTGMASMFSGSNFNQSIEHWDVSNVVTMSSMFYPSEFNQSIGNWNVSKVKNMDRMFSDSKFNQPIGNWDVSNVNSMIQMFVSSEFDHPLENWDVSNVTSMLGMFVNSKFNQPIEKWNVKNVTRMGSMFEESKFNQPIGNWNVENVTEMTRMFQMNPNFNQDLSKWCVSKISFTPFNFNLGATSWTLPKPVWGTCPD